MFLVVFDVKHPDVPQLPVTPMSALKHKSMCLQGLPLVDTGLKHCVDTGLLIRMGTQCDQVYGILEHKLASCPALTPVKERLYNMWLETSVIFPTLHSTIRNILGSDESIFAQFILEAELALAVGVPVGWRSGS